MSPDATRLSVIGKLDKGHKGLALLDLRRIADVMGREYIQEFLATLFSLANFRSMRESWK